MRQLMLLGVLLFATLPVVATTTTAVPLPRISDDEIHLVRGDAKGGVHVFTETGRVFELNARGESEEVTTPHFVNLLGQPLQVAVGADGWLFGGNGRRSVVHVDGDTVREVDAPAAIRGLALWGDTPVVNLIYSPSDTMAANLYAKSPELSDMPIAYRHNERDGKWYGLASESLPEGDDQAADRASYYQLSVLMAPDQDGAGRLWVANAFEYRVRRFSASRKPLLDVHFPSLRTPERWEDAENDFLAQVRDKGYDLSKIKGFSVAPGEAIIRALTAHEGEAYLVWRDPETPANHVQVDRITSLGEVYRTLISIPNADKIQSIAIGVRQIYLGTYDSGLYFVDRDGLESTWFKVDPLATE